MPLSCARLGYIGVTLNNGMYSPSLKKPPPAAKFVFGFGIATSTPSIGAKSSSG